MKNYKNKYKGHTIEITEVNADRVDYKVLKPNGELLQDSDGYCVTVDEAMDECKDIIEESLGN